jgi:hypothetical protein
MEPPVLENDWDKVPALPEQTSVDVVPLGLSAES